MRFDVLKEKLMMNIAWKMPRWLVYFCAIRLGSNASTGKYEKQIYPELNFFDAVKRWENGN